MGILFHCPRTICLLKQEDQCAEIYSEETLRFLRTNLDLSAFCRLAIVSQRAPFIKSASTVSVSVKCYSISTAVKNVLNKFTKKKKATFSNICRG